MCGELGASASPSCECAGPQHPRRTSSDAANRTQRQHAGQGRHATNAVQLRADSTFLLRHVPAPTSQISAPGSGSFGEVFLARWKKGSTQLVNNVNEPRSGQVRRSAQNTRMVSLRRHFRRHVCSSPRAGRTRAHPAAFPPQFAVKVLRDSSLSDPRAVQDFKAEARRMLATFVQGHRRLALPSRHLLRATRISSDSLRFTARCLRRSKSSASSATVTSSTTSASAPGPTPRLTGGCSSSRWRR